MVVGLVELGHLPKRIDHNRVRDLPRLGHEAGDGHHHRAAGRDCSEVAVELSTDQRANQAALATGRLESSIHEVRGRSVDEADVRYILLFPISN